MNKRSVNIIHYYSFDLVWLGLLQVFNILRKGMSNSGPNVGYWLGVVDVLVKPTQLSKKPDKGKRSE